MSTTLHINRSRRFAAGLVALAGVVALAACGSSKGSPKTGPGNGSSDQPPTSASSIRDGVLQIRTLSATGDSHEIVVETSDGTVVHKVTLPFDPGAGVATGPGRVLYSGTGQMLALVDGSKGSVKILKAPGTDYFPTPTSAIGPYPARYFLVQSGATSPSQLFDTQTGTLLDLSTVTNHALIVTSLFNSPDGHEVLVGDDKDAVIFDPANPAKAHHFAKYASAGGFTADGHAVVAEPVDRTHDRVVAYDPAKGTTTSLVGNRTHTGGPLIASTAGSTVVVAEGANLDLVSVDGKKDRKVSTGDSDISTLRPGLDGRHVLVRAGLDPEATWFQLDASTGALTNLPTLANTRPAVGTASTQRYLLFAPIANTVLLKKAYTVDTFTGKVTAVTLPGASLTSASSDGKIRTLSGSGTVASSLVLDASSGSVTTLKGSATASVSPSGLLLTLFSGRHPLEVTDIKGKHVANLTAGIPVWTTA